MMTLTLTNSQYAMVLVALSDYAQRHRTESIKSRAAVDAGFRAGLTEKQYQALIKNHMSSAQCAVDLIENITQHGETSYA